MSKYEKRMHTVSLEARLVEGDGAKVLTGYAAVFNQRALVDDEFYEVILPGAFSRTLVENNDVLALKNHNFDHILGRTSNGLLRLEEDSHGLHFELNLPDTPLAQQVYDDVQCGNLKDCSFLFTTVFDEWDYSGDKPLCILKDVDLIEISIVSIPVYDGTEVTARSKERAAAGALKTKLQAQIKNILEVHTHG